MINFFLKNLKGASFCFLLKEDEKVAQIKKKFFHKVKILPENQILYYEGKILQDEKFLIRDYCLKNDCNIYLKGSLKGGGRAPRFKQQISLNQYPKIEKGLSKISNKNVVELRTGKIHIIRILLECIKYIIHETNIIFYPNKSNTKNKDDSEITDIITISKQDSSQTVAIHIELKGDEFEHYFCDEKTVIGINIMDFFKVIKSVDKDDIIFLYIEKNNYNSFFIQTENSKSEEITQTSISTIEIEDEGLEIPELEFEQFLEIPSQKFQKICKDFGTFKVKEIQIELLDKKLIFSSKDEINRTVILHTETNDCENSNDDTNISDKIDVYMYKAIFTLGYFNHFTKATPLCDKVSLFLKNDGPFMIQYKIINVGEISFILSSNDE